MAPRAEASLIARTSRGVEVSVMSTDLRNMGVLLSATLGLRFRWREHSRLLVCASSEPRGSENVPAFTIVYASFTGHLQAAGGRGRARPKPLPWPGSFRDMLRSQWSAFAVVATVCLGSGAENLTLECRVRAP